MKARATRPDQGQRNTKLRKPKTRQVGSEAEGESISEVPVGRNIIVAIGINEYQYHTPLDNPIPVLEEMQMVTVLYQIPEEMELRPVDFQAIEAAFANR